MFAKMWLAVAVIGVMYSVTLVASSIPLEWGPEIGGKEMSGLPVFVNGEIMMYDTSDIGIGLTGSRMLRLGQELPVLQTPTIETARGVRKFMPVTKETFIKNGYKVADGPCDGCVEIKIHFAVYRRNANVLIIMGRYDALYRGHLIAASKDKGWEITKRKFTPEGAELEDGMAALAEWSRKSLESDWNTRVSVP